MAHLELIITTPEREVLRRPVESLSVPTVDGEITVLPQHVPLTAVLKAGEMIIRHDGKAEPYAIGGGFIEVQPNKVVILADTAEHVVEIDEQRVQEAIARAEKTKQEMSKEHVDYARMAAKLERDLARLRVVKKHRSHTQPHIGP
ncbi:MAG: ATP synthase F1 subunit epsilon [Candidatus Kerfeldbacteria bacterium]|nr:ATP synthase F1 subunit epsilon [Candidatus Kerfeldbacteria bacterium]